MKKYPQLLVLKNTQHFAKEPLSKILCASQMAEYNQLYGKYSKNSYKISGAKLQTFE